MQPFLKWAGGKRWLVPKILKNLPKFNVYYEPFVGSGALFFALEPRSAILSDSNPELMNCYRAVRNHCKSVINVLNELRIAKKTFYEIREKFWLEDDRIKKAAYFIYLNKTCWNGLYRVNRDGKFNVPVGRHVRVGYKVFDPEHLQCASRLLKRATIKCGDFEEAVKGARKNDLVYFDPPYITTHLKDSFIKYNSILFHQSDELRLAQLAEKLARRGTLVVLSNAAHPLIKDQYNGVFLKTELLRPSLIAGDPTKRTKFLELLVSNFALEVEGVKRVTRKIPPYLKYKPSYNPKCRL